MANDPWVRWSNLIPLDVREIVGRYDKRHWHLLSMAARCGSPAIDLMTSNPALAWALASSWVFRLKPVDSPMRSIRRLLAPGKSQRDILAWLDFPSTDAARRQMRKLDPKAASVNCLLSLRDAMQNPESMKVLCHLPALNWGAIRILADPELRPYANRSFVASILSDNAKQGADATSQNTDIGYATTAMRMHDCLRMLDALGDTRNRLRGMRARDDVLALHDGLVRRYDPKWSGGAGESHSMVHFPAPPVPGTESIIPITTLSSLVREGLDMEHCVGSYGRLVADGEAAIYKILSPERATLALNRHGRSWRVREIRCKGNAEASSATWMQISAWLKRVCLNLD